MIRTYSGKYIDLFDLHERDIEIIDICRGLSNIPRFAGQAQFFSVARHSIDVCNSLPKEHKLAGLLHDASEAYIGDMATPIKTKLPDYKKLEKGIMKVVEKKYKINTGHPAVKEADRAALKREKSILWTDSNKDEDNEQTRIEFLRLFHQYVNL